MNKHWVIKKEYRELNTDTFLSDIENVCRKHGLSISHEDSHGSFIIETFNQENIEWLKFALVTQEAAEQVGIIKEAR